MAHEFRDWQENTNSIFAQPRCGTTVDRVYSPDAGTREYVAFWLGPVSGWDFRSSLALQQHEGGLT
ncbi:MAG: hypothetical protein WBR26_13095 [Candidatus Acidiferrum sp.]